MDKLIFWGAVAAAGVVMGTYMPFSKVIRLLVTLVVVAFVGGFGAAFSGLIRPEWLYLLMLVLPVAGVLFVCAFLANAVASRRKKDAGDTVSG